jgi:hypothetical protein
VKHWCELVTVSTFFLTSTPFYWIVSSPAGGSFCTTSKNGGEEMALDAADWMAS